MSKASKPERPKGPIERCSPIDHDHPVPEYLRALQELGPVTQNDGFDDSDACYDELLMDKSSEKLLAENGALKEFHVDILFQALADGLKKIGLNKESRAGEIKAFSEQSGIVTRLLERNSLGTAANDEELLFHQISRILIEDTILQASKRPTYALRIKKATKAALLARDHQNANLPDLDGRVKDTANRYKCNYELNLARSLNGTNRSRQKVKNLLNAIDALGRFGIPIDTSTIRADLRRRGFPV